MLITQKPEYTRKIEEDRLSPFSNDEVLLNVADKTLSNVDAHTAHTYYNYAIVLNSHMERALACESPRLQPAVQRLCELSSLVGKAADIRVAGDEQKSLSAFTKALLTRRAADLILVHHATSSLNTKCNPEWKVCVSALSRLALYWLAACNHYDYLRLAWEWCNECYDSTTPATSALVALEALEANAIRKYLAVDEERVERLLQNPECAERLGDACGATCPSATASPSRSGLSFTPTLISFVPLAGFEKCIEEAVDKDVPSPLTEDKYGKCIGALATTLDNSMVLRRLVNVMRIDSVLATGAFIDALFPSLSAYPNEASFKGHLFNPELSRFDLKCYLVFLMGWTRVSLSSRLSPMSGPSRLFSPAPLPSSIFTQHQMTLWNALILRAQKRFTGPTEHALSVQGVKKVTRLMTAPPVPLMGTVFYTIRDDSAAGYVTEVYARKIVETICCSDPSADRAIFRTPQGGIEFDGDDETRLLHDASIFISRREMENGDWTGAERSLLMCDEGEKIVEQLVEVYSGWLKIVDSNGRAEVERKLMEMKGKLHKLSPSRWDNDKDEGRRTDNVTFVKGLESGKSRSPAISIEGDDLNNSFASSEYTSAPTTPFKNGTIFGAETPTFHTPGGRPSLWPGAIQRNLFIQATQNASSTPKSSRSSIPVECREEEVQTDADDCVFTPEPSISAVSLDQTHTSVSYQNQSVYEEALPEDAFELESLMKSLDLINDGFVQRTKAKVVQLDQAHKEEEEEERRRQEENEKTKREADEEIRVFNEKIEKKKVAMTPKTPSQPVHAGHRPLGAAPTVDALPSLGGLRTPSSLSRLPPQQQQQQQLLHSYLQQPTIAAAAATVPSPLPTTGSVLLQHLLGAVSGPASVQSLGVQRMGQLPQAATWTASRPLFPTAPQQQQQQLQPKPVQQVQWKGEEQRKVETVLAPKPLNAFEAAFMKKKEEERIVKEENEGQHKGCFCCATEEEQDRWFAAYEKVSERNDKVN